MSRFVFGVLVSAAVFFVSSGRASASCAQDRCSMVTVTQLYVAQDDPVIFVGTSGDENGLANCTADDGKVIAINIVRASGQSGENNFQQVYQALLAAQLAGREVSIYTKNTEGNAGQCVVSYVVVN